MPARFVLILAMAFAVLAQDRTTLPRPATPAQQNQQASDGTYILKAGTRIPLTLMNTVSSRNAAAGDQIYLQTMVPVAIDGQIVVPVGTYVTGAITQSVRPGKVKGKGELAVRFTQLMFPNGSSVDLTGRLGALDGSVKGDLDRDEGKVTSDGAITRDAVAVGGTAVAGTAMGNWIGGQGSNAAIGAGAGAAAGLAGVLLTRGPEATLRRGDTLEMVLSQDLRVPRKAVRP